ncbi:hypothetical protein PV326_007702 [Microctonus aethiopoides]|nr:hypothetical protein PV326_007702 [Microctonus aethiopoides]
MKDLISIWGRLAGRSYSSVNANTHQTSANEAGDSSDSDPNNLQTKSPIVVNRFFNSPLSRRSNGRRKYPKIYERD